MMESFRLVFHLSSRELWIPHSSSLIVTQIVLDCMRNNGLDFFVLRIFVLICVFFEDLTSQTGFEVYLTQIWHLMLICVSGFL